MRNKNFNASIFSFSQNQEDACEVKLDESGRLHALDEPAVIYPELEEQWWKNGKLHREDGPAVIEIDGSHEYWIKGECTRSMRAD